MTPQGSPGNTEPTEVPHRSRGLESELDERRSEALAAGGNGASEATDGPADRIVPVASYCDGCDHLSEPPDFRCEHHTGRIVDVVDRTHVRVRGCPFAEDDGQTE